MTGRLLIFVGVLGASLAVVSAQQPVPQGPSAGGVTFRAGVDLVEVNAVVTDQRGQLVTGLTQADFEILEDRRAQTIAAFAAVARPLAALDPQSPAAAPVAVDVRSNLNANGTAFGIVLDGLNISRERTQAVRASVRSFLERSLSADDFAAMVVTGSTTTSALSQQFTTSRPGLFATLDRFTGTKAADSLPIARQSGGSDPLESDAPGGVADPADTERATRAQASLSTLRNLADSLAGVRGRRSVIVFVSEGVEHDDSDMAGRTPRIVRDGVKAVIDAAARSNVTIYAIDPRMLAGANGRGAFGPLVAAAQQILRDVAEGTGGRAATSVADAAAAFDRISADARTYYSLAYASDRRDGRFRRLDVRVKRSGLRVFARRGRFAPGEPVGDTGGATPLALREVMASPLPVTQMPLSIFAAPFKDQSRDAAVLVSFEWPARADHFGIRSGSTPNTLDLDVSAYDDRGALTGGARHTITTTFEPASVESIRARGLRLMSQIMLPPGRYQLRVSATESVGATAGSVMYDLVVPDFSTLPFAMSGVSVYVWPERPAQLSTGAQAVMSSVLPWPPTLEREFRTEDEIALFAEVYDTARDGSPHRLSFGATLENLEGRVLVRDLTEWSSADARGHRDEYGVQARLSLKDVPPGLYVIRVEARADLASARPVTSFIPVRVLTLAPNP